MRARGFIQAAVYLGGILCYVKGFSSTGVTINQISPHRVSSPLREGLKPHGFPKSFQVVCRGDRLDLLNQDGDSGGDNNDSGGDENGGRRNGGDGGGGSDDGSEHDPRGIFGSLMLVFQKVRKWSGGFLGTSEAGRGGGGGLGGGQMSGVGQLSWRTVAKVAGGSAAGVGFPLGLWSGASLSHRFPSGLEGATNRWRRNGNKGNNSHNSTKLLLIVANLTQKLQEASVQVDRWRSEATQAYDQKAKLDQEARSQRLRIDELEVSLR
jgi:hypothetical protein